MRLATRDASQRVEPSRQKPGKVPKFPGCASPSSSLPPVRSTPFAPPSRTAPTPSTWEPSRFNARDEGAQLTLEELGEACRIAHERGRRIYLTLNILIKPAELVDALLFLGDAIDLGIDAVIVQDIGLVRLIQRIYPDLEIHGSTQMTVHDETRRRA